MSKLRKILVINPGSTTTKVALYENEKKINTKNLEHSSDEIEQYIEINDQMDMRKNAVLEYLKESGVKPEELAAIATRGGTFGYARSGAYIVDEKLIEACKNPLAPHASNLAAIIGYEIGHPFGIDTYIYDAVCVDEAEDMVKISGMPEITRQMFTHVLNSRAVSIKVAEEAGKKINEMTFIVTHMGGGISTNLIKKGIFADIVADDEGTFSPERTGRVGERNLIKLFCQCSMSEKEMQKKIRGKGGLVAYLGTNNAIKVEAMIKNGNKRAKEVYQALAYQISKDIGSLAAASNGNIDYIVLTGGIAYSEMMTRWIREKVKFIAPVKIIPGTFEMEALAFGILRVLKGEEEVHHFT